MADILTPNSQAGSSSDKAPEDIYLYVQKYRAYLEIAEASLIKLNHLTNNWKFFDLRFLGVLLMIFSLFVRLFCYMRCPLSPTEFILLFSIGTGLLLLGSYFRVLESKNIGTVITNAGEMVKKELKIVSGPSAGTNK
jgi:hypothetical protein